MSRTILIAALAALVLSGCTVSAEERRTRDQQTCRGYGFVEGSEAFANCMLQLDLDRRAARREALNSAPPLFPPTVVVVREQQQTP
ncbi:hypothetical protein [Pelagibacterium sediminicola]|uniref:hypothetical protein n=1 Tax=Pelagibacterium sediminicola TaxID=2248761 RepID=UPI000E310219|nr:hypothetical protein [Pelagibacterium sediminicola]